MPERIHSQEMASFLWHSSREGMAIVSEDGIIIDVNPAFSSMLGYSPLELRGKRFTEITVKEDQEAEAQQFQELVSNKIPYYSMDKSYYTKRGSIVRGRLRVQRFLNDIYMFGQVIPIDPVFDPSNDMTQDQRALIIEQAIGHIARKHWKQILAVIIGLIAMTAGAVNIEEILSIFIGLKG